MPNCNGGLFTREHTYFISERFEQFSQEFNFANERFEQFSQEFNFANFIKICEIREIFFPQKFLPLK